MGQDEVFRRYPLAGRIGELARLIRSRTGAAGGGADCPEVREALRGCFPRLTAAAGLEGCTTHPALTLRFRATASGREAVKVVLLPREEALEARVRLELPGGSYRKATLAGLMAFIEEVEAALASPAGSGSNPGDGDGQ